MKEGIIMKMRYCFLFIPLLFLSPSCGSGEKADLSDLSSKSRFVVPEKTEISEESQSSNRTSVNTPETRFLNHLIGIYEGEYKDKMFEVRIEEWKQHAPTGEQLLYVFVFEKSKSSNTQEFLTRHTDVQAYVEDICNYVEENPNKFSEHDLQTSPSMFYDISADQVWRWNNSIGALGYFTVPVNGKASVSSFDIKIRHYINLHTDDEYGLKKIYLNDKGEAVKIQFFETGFIKKPWNYFMHGPSLNISKVSSETKDVLTQYYNTVNETRELFLKAGEENHSYCDIK